MTSPLRVCFLPENHDAGGCYRCFFPAKELRKRGIEAASPTYDGLAEDELLRSAGAQNEFARFTIRDPDQIFRIGAQVYVFQRQLEHQVLHTMEALKIVQDAAIVADCDDDLLGIPGYNPSWEGLHPKVSPNRNRNIFLKSLQLADAVTVTTPLLAERLSRYNPNVHVLPNYLDWEMWEDVEPQYEVRREKIRVGWMGASFWHAGDLAVLRGLIGPWLQRHPEVEFVAAGDESVHDFLGIPEGQRVSYPSVHFRDFKLAEITATMDIGLVPLEENKFNDCKSDLKGKEYAACGIPCIASPTESYRSWVTEGENGFLAKRPKDWLRALDTLVFDDGLRREMGRAARAKASEHTIQKHVGEWETLYRSLSREPDLADTAIQFGAAQKHGELKDLFDLLEDRPLNTVVEIGTSRGGTFKAFCELAPADALLVSIDMPGGFGADKRGLQEIEKLRSYGQESQDLRFLRADSHAPHTLAHLKGILAGRRIDLLFIDGDHSYEGVKADFELYGPLADLVVFHDIVEHWRKEVDGVPIDVHRFWEEIKGRYPYREFVRPGGWGGLGALEMTAGAVAA